MTVTDAGPSPEGAGLLPAARAVHLVKSYGSGDAVVHALDGVNVEFAAGQFTAVMGPSGSGKSTLMHCMAGLDTPDLGPDLRRRPGDRQLDDAGLTQMRRDRIGFVFQSFNLVPTLTAAENITLPADLAGGKVDPDWFDYLVDQLGIADRLDHRPNEMSGGQQQRVACARALIGRPDLIFADEPTGNLDSNASAEMLDVPPPLGDRVRPVDRHGHPRRPGRGLRRPGRVPGRRPGGRRAPRADRRLRAGADEAPGQLTCGRSPSRACWPTSCGWR